MTEPTRTQLYTAYQVARNALIKQMVGSGETYEAVARTLSLKPLQVKLIAASVASEKSRP